MITESVLFSGVDASQIYSDPFGGSFPMSRQVYKDHFKVITFRQGIPHPEYDDYLHMGQVPAVTEANAIRQNGIAGNAYRANQDDQTVPAVQTAPIFDADPPRRTFIHLCSSGDLSATDDCYADNGSCSMVKITPDIDLRSSAGVDYVLQQVRVATSIHPAAHGTKEN